MKPFSVIGKYNVVAERDGEGQPSKKAWFLHPCGGPGVEVQYASVRRQASTYGWPAFEQSSEDVPNRYFRGWTATGGPLEADVCVSPGNRKSNITGYSGWDEDYLPYLNMTRSWRNCGQDTNSVNSLPMQDQSPNNRAHSYPPAFTQWDGDTQFAAPFPPDGSTSSVVSPSVGTYSGPDAGLVTLTLDDEETDEIALARPNPIYGVGVTGGTGNPIRMGVFNLGSTPHAPPEDVEGTDSSSEWSRNGRNIVKQTCKYGFALSGLCPGYDYILQWKIEAREQFADWDYEHENTEWEPNKDWYLYEEKQVVITAPTTREPDESGDYSYLVDVYLANEDPEEESGAEPSIDMPHSQYRSYRLADVVIYPAWARILDIPNEWES